MSESPSRNSWDLVFNTPLETGLRSAALLLAAYPSYCDLQRLVQYDYLLVHSGDVDDGPPSLHPATPHRSGELLVRRFLVEQGLDFMSKREVVEKVFTESGIVFIAGEYAFLFIDSLTTSYAKLLRDRAEWVIARFQSLSNLELDTLMRQHWSVWGSEFTREYLIREAPQ